MQNQQDRAWWPGSTGAAIAVVVALVVVAGCGDRCVSGQPEIPDEQVLPVQDSLVDQVALVARLLDFEKRRFDNQHWWAEAVESGMLIGREDTPGGIAQKPTRQVHDFVVEVLGDQAPHVQWDGHLDVAVWRGENRDQPRGWAMSIPVADDISLEGATDWQLEGYISRAESSDARLIPVYASHDEEADTPVYAAIVDTVPALNGSHEAQSVAISNFEAGPARLGEAVQSAGPSGADVAELHLWPRRIGIAQRHHRLAQVMTQTLATRGYQLPVAQLGLMRRRTEWQWAMGTPHHWPRRITMSMHVERDQATRGATRVHIDARVSADDHRVVEALSGAVVEEEFRRAIALQDAPKRLDIGVTAERAPNILSSLIPDSWLEMLSVRGAERRRALAEAFQSLFDHQSGGMSFAFYDSVVPMGMTGEFFLGFSVSDEQATDRRAQRFHEHLLDDHWRHLFDHADEVFSEGIDTTLGDADVRFEKRTFLIGHGHGFAGVCWTVSDGEYLSYYGVRPCERLHEVVDEQGSPSTRAPIAYRGDFRELVDDLYIRPMDGSADVFGELDIEIEIEGRAVEEGAIQLSTEFRDLRILAKLIDGLRQLHQFWAPESYFDEGMLVDELGLNTPAYQEPSIAAIGPPAMGGVLPPSLMLGMPFAYPPFRPTAYRALYFSDSPPEGHSH